MQVKQAKQLAREWVLEHAPGMPGFYGAFFHGSINWLADDDILPAASDVDVMVVLDGEPSIKLGKLVYRDLLLEVSYLARDELRSPAFVLSQSHMAGSFRGAGVIADPSGQLTELQAAVSRDYARRHWVRKRCEHARDKVLNNLSGVRAGVPFHDQVSAWLFGTGVTTHILLVASLRNPTVRRRYLAVRRLLEDYGQAPFYITLLELLGCAGLGRERVAQQLVALEAVFDAAAEQITSPFFFASDISRQTRPIAIDGSRELIERGDHREAVFWIVATYARCQKVLYHDAPPELQARYDPGFHELLGDLGIASFADLKRRSAQVEQQLPRIWEVAETIMEANPEID